MPRSLVSPSYWKRVATSGPTADRREITPQELRDIAETYKPSYYTAVIWADHERWPGSHGTVLRRATGRAERTIPSWRKARSPWKRS